MDADAIFDKIKKLQRMADSNSPNEAAIAAVKIQNLLRDYNLQLNDVLSSGETDRGDILIDVLMPWTPRCDAWQDILANGIANNSYCKAIKDQKFVGTTEVKENKRNAKGWKYIKAYRIIIIGKRINTDSAIYQYNNLCVQLERMAEIEFNNYKRLGGRAHGKAWKNTFFMAAVTIIIKLMRSEKETAEKTNPALNTLALARLDEVNKFVQENYNELEPGKSKKYKTINSAINAGYNAGNSIKVQNAVSAAGLAETLKLE